MVLHPIARRPLMRCIRDDDCPIRELDLIARPAKQDVRRSDHPRRLPIGAQQPIPNRNVTHGGPARRRRQRRIERQRLTHTGPGRDDDHLTRMQAVGHLVEFDEPRRHATGQAAVGCDRVDLVHRRLQQILERHEVFGRAALGDVVDLGLRAVDDLGDVRALGARVAVLDHPGARLDQPAQQRLLRDDARVIARVGCGRHRRDQRVQIRRPTDPPQQARGDPARRPPSPHRPARRGHRDRGSRRRRSDARAGRSRRDAAAQARRRSRPCSAACPPGPPVRPPRPGVADDRSPHWAAERPYPNGRGHPRQPQTVPPPLAQVERMFAYRSTERKSDDRHLPPRESRTVPCDGQR